MHFWWVGVVRALGGPIVMDVIFGGLVCTGCIGCDG
jgi:hypothetical protein